MFIHGEMDSVLYFKLEHLSQNIPYTWSVKNNPSVFSLHKATLQNSNLFIPHHPAKKDSLSKLPIFQIVWKSIEYIGVI